MNSDWKQQFDIGTYLTMKCWSSYGLSVRNNAKCWAKLAAAGWQDSTGTVQCDFDFPVEPGEGCDGSGCGGGGRGVPMQLTNRLHTLPSILIQTTKSKRTHTAGKFSIGLMGLGKNMLCKLAKSDFCLALLQVLKCFVFVPDQKFIHILWQSQTFRARKKDGLIQ